MPRTSKAKKPILVLATSASVNSANKKTQVTQAIQEEKEVILDQVQFIHYSVQCWKDNKVTLQALIDSGSEFNTMTLAYAKKLGLQTQKTNIGAQKIDNSLLKTYGMVIAAF